MNVELLGTNKLGVCEKDEKQKIKRVIARERRNGEKHLIAVIFAFRDGVVLVLRRVELRLLVSRGA
jgi:hypothetical protein